MENSRTNSTSYEKYAIFALILIFSLMWSYITVKRYDAFNADVLDLGVNSNLLYGVFHSHFSLQNIAFNKLIYLIIAPFYNIYPDPRVLLVFQSFWITLGAYPVYRIAKYEFSDGLPAMLIATSYLIYFPLGGVYWYDFHFMALFPTLFLFGVMSLQLGRMKSFLIFMGLAAITDLLVPIILVFLGFACLFRPKWNPLYPLAKKPILITLGLSLAVLTSVALYFSPSYLYDWMNKPFTTEFYSAVTSNLSYKVEYFIILLIPVLFLSLLESKLLVMIIPYALLVFSHNFQPYFTPMYYQYPALTAPILFVTAVIGMKKLTQIKKLRRAKLKHIAATVLIVNLILAAFLSPLGSLVTGYGGSYDVQAKISYTEQDAAINNMLSMIPKGSSILIQGNMPQLTNGYQWVLPTEPIGHNLPEYALSDPYSYYYQNNLSISGNTTSNFQSEFQYLLSSGDYHVVASQYNITLIQHD